MVNPGSAGTNGVNAQACTQFMATHNRLPYIGQHVHIYYIIHVYTEARQPSTSLECLVHVDIDMLAQPVAESPLF